MVSELSDRRFVLDTHGLRWYWNDPGRLSPLAQAIFSAMERREVEGLIPALVIAELHYVAAKLRQPMPAEAILRIVDGAPAWRLEPLTRRHLLASDRLTAIPEMHDRLIAAVALVQDAPILTRDPQLQAGRSGWRVQ